MNEDALRALVRESIARQMSGPPAARLQDFPAPVSFVGHASHYRYTLPKSDGPCIIEPGVACNHCGYCESHGN